jgi:hypothetical protein
MLKSTTNPCIILKIPFIEIYTKLKKENYIMSKMSDLDISIREDIESGMYLDEVLKRYVPSVSADSIIEIWEEINGPADGASDDGQPSEYTEWQDYMGGDDWDQGQYDGEF